MVKSVGYSVKGSRSDENEDSYLVVSHRGLFVVADGVGGGPNGREASKCLVKELMEALQGDIDRNSILNAIAQANAKVKKMADSKSVRGMASTLAALWLDGKNALVFNVGDSRVYRITVAGGINQLTNDHSHMLDNEQKSKNVITKAVGIKEKIDVEVDVFPWIEGEKFVLVSDGVSDVVDDTRIADIVSSSALSMLEKCSAIVTEAENKGGRDDKTIILVTT
jgi:protein phosphatase